MEGRNELIKKFNEAFATCNTNFLVNSVTEDIRWEIVGEKMITGKKDFTKSLDRMSHGGPTEIKVKEIINVDDKSVVEGVVEFFVEPGKKKKYAFCDVYIFSETDDKKFKELRTYVSLLKTEY